jgi:hypothetical protein
MMHSLRCYGYMSHGESHGACAFSHGLDICTISVRASGFVAMCFPVTFVARGELMGVFSCLHAPDVWPLIPEPSSANKTF